MIKFRFYYDKDKETNWLNEMVQKGYAMTKFFAGFYTFEACEPGEYIYQIDFSDKLLGISKDYREFMEEAGAEIVQPWGYWIFLRQKTTSGAFQLYTDTDSSIEHYTKIRNMFKRAAVIELICFFMEIFAAIYSSQLFIIAALLIMAFFVGMLRTVIKTNQIIAGLQEQRGESAQYNKKFEQSPILISGLMLNTCALAMQNPDNHIVKFIIQIFAIALMLIGLYRIAMNRNN